MSCRAMASVDGAGESKSRGFLAAAASSAATAFDSSGSSIHISFVVSCRRRDGSSARLPCDEFVRPRSIAEHRRAVFRSHF